MKKKNQMRISALNDMGFVWDASSFPPKSHRGDDNWRRMYDRLAQYRNVHGHCRVPSSCPLGQWVVRQRFHHRRQRASSELGVDGGGGRRNPPPPSRRNGCACCPSSTSSGRRIPRMRGMDACASCENSNRGTDTYWSRGTTRPIPS